MQRVLYFLLQVYHKHRENNLPTFCNPNEKDRANTVISAKWK